MFAETGTGGFDSLICERRRDGGGAGGQTERRVSAATGVAAADENVKLPLSPTLTRRDAHARKVEGRVQDDVSLLLWSETQSPFTLIEPRALKGVSLVT